MGRASATDGCHTHKMGAEITLRLRLLTLHDPGRIFFQELLTRKKRNIKLASQSNMSINGSSGTRSRKRRILYKARVTVQDRCNAVRPAAQAATWSGGPDGVASGCHGRLVAAGLSDARVQGKGSLATLGSCLKNPAVNLANIPANRQRGPKVIPTLLAMPLAETFAGHRSRWPL